MVVVMIVVVMLVVERALLDEEGNLTPAFSPPPLSLSLSLSLSPFIRLTWSRGCERGREARDEEERKRRGK